VSAPIITFFNNKGGVGKTSLVYHLAWMLAELGHRVVAADLGPQANLTAAFLAEEEIEQLWSAGETRTIWSAIRPFVDDEGSIQAITPISTADEHLVLLPSELTLSRFEDELSTQWRDCLEGTRLRPFLVMSAFWTVLQRQLWPTKRKSYWSMSVRASVPSTVLRWWPPITWWFRWLRTCSACKVCGTWGRRCGNGARVGASVSTSVPRMIESSPPARCSRWATCYSLMGYASTARCRPTSAG